MPQTRVLQRDTSDIGSHHQVSYLVNQRTFFESVLWVILIIARPQANNITLKIQLWLFFLSPTSHKHQFYGAMRGFLQG